MPAIASRTLLTCASLLLTLACGGGGGGADKTTSAETSDSSGTTEPAASTSTATSAPTTTGTTEPATTDTGVAPTSGGSTTVDLTTSTTEPGTTDTSTSTTDTSTSTTGTDTTDTSTGTSTTGEPDALGELSGDCGLIDAMELDSPAPFVFSSAIDFGDLGFEYALLTPGGQQIFDEGNLNPSSLHSEIVAYEILARCELATLLKTEDTIVYTNPMGKKTDLLVEFDDPINLTKFKIGVSVVRAVGFPKDAPYTVAQAETILNGKLGDILISSQNVAPEDAWHKQILHVIAYGPMHVESVLTAYEALGADLKADTILVVSVTNGDDAFIYM